MSETDSSDQQVRRPTLVVVCGLPGVGKTTVAEDVADRLDGRLLRTDVIRKELFPDPDYTEEEARMVYDELFERARTGIERGRSMVLDGTFKDGANRTHARELSEALDVPFRMVRVECDEEVVRDRIQRREDDESDADFEIHQLYREQFDAISGDYVTVDNSAGLDATAQQVDEQF